jgi:serine/threonine-protein kinase
MNKGLSAGSILLHYRIVSKIGEGGMGEVYLAQDTKLDRKVALKILPADVASNRDRMERFTREARSAAALNHPNIAHIYEIGDSDGTHYIAMEFIDGETLRHKIHREKAPLSKLLKYLIQVARGLSKAHAAGIVHRDLKPDNIMITRDDYAKVLDFGLAKLVEPERTFGINESGSSEIATAVMQQPGHQVAQSGWDSGHSTPGMVIGTIGYMSPEQASGRVDEIDLRSDIFSFGCILFEAATGQRAFAGKDVLDSLHKIVHAPTPQLKDANPLAPAELQRVVRRCLAKEREKRYQSIKELAIELEDFQQELKGFTESEYSGHPTPATSASTSGMVRGDEGFRIAVLPFKVRDADPSVAVLADGLSEEIVTGLSRFRYLSVVTSTSAARPKGETEEEGSLAAKRGTRYALEGSIRKGGSAIRVSAQLVDSETGAQLWSETYNRDLQTSTIFAVQDDVAGRIVATVADSYGVLVHSMRAASRKKDDVDLTPVEWQFQYFAYREQITPSNHAALRSRLARALERDDGQSDLWACLAQIYVDEYAFGFQGDATSLDRALAAGRRAVELDRANQFALVALAQVHFFRQDLAAFGPAAERAMALNPLNTDALGILGLEIVHTAEFERGTAIVRHAMELNPNHAGWMHFAPLWDHFNKGEYERALECANRVDVPGLFWPFLVMASACGHLGRHTEAAAAVRDLLTLDPEFAAHARINVGTWHFASGLMDPILEGLRKAGLEIADDKSSSSRFSPQTSPTNSLGSLLQSIAVLPFQNLSVDPEQEFFADGITEEILNSLAQIKELRVAGRSSSFSFKGRNEDLRSVGAKLNVTNILEGTLRRSGDRLRITAQLIDAVSGYQLWSERYDRVLKDIFNIQDEIALAVVDALKLKLFGDAKEVVVRRYTDDVEVHELFLKGRYYSYKYTAEGWTRAVEFFEEVIEKYPDHAPAHAGKAAALGCLWFFGLTPSDEAVPPFRSAATKAIELDGNLAGAHLSLGMVNFFHDWEWEKAEQEFKQAILLNPKDAEALSYYAMFLGFVDRFDEAMALARRALEVDPLSLLINMNVGWTYFAAGLANEAFDQARKMTEIEPKFFGAYWLKGATRLGSGDYEEAIEQLTKAVSLGGHPIVLADLGAAYALAGKKEPAETILDQLLVMRRQSYVPAICLARVYSRLGELEKTIQWLETAYEERNGELVFLENEITSAAKGDSLNSLGKDPRVMDLLERMKLPTREASRDQGE